MHVLAWAILIGAMLQASPATGASKPSPAPLPESVEDHEIWGPAGALDRSRHAWVRDAVRRDGAERVLAILDFLHEARSPVADGDHRDAALAIQALGPRKRRVLIEDLAAWARNAAAARARDDVDALLQEQTRISVVTAELAGRRDALDSPATRSRAVRDLRRLIRFADRSVWERHVLNYRLRGALHLATDPPDARIDGYYRDAERAGLDARMRARYLKVLADLEGGGFDALNAYDWGGVSIGLAQFAASSPYLGELLVRVRADRPRKFDRLVASRGLRLGPEGEVRYGGEPLIAAIHSMERQHEFNAVLLAFVAGFENRKLRRSLERAQLDLADALLDDALALRSRGGERLADRLGTPRGRVHLADAFINTGEDDTLAVFRRAVRTHGEAGASLVDAFVEQRRRLYRETGQPYQLRRIEALESAFGP